MLDELKKLYSLSFDDSKDYIDYFFSHKYQTSNSLLYYDKEMLISMLFLIPKVIRLGAKDLFCPFIVGACTHPNYRGMGLMNRLLYDALVKLHNEDKLITALYPFRHSFYEKQGFSSVSFTNKTKIEYNPHQEFDVINATDSDIQVMLDLYNQEMSKIDIYILRDYREMFDKYKETHMTGENKLIFSDKKLIGYIMYDTEEIIEAIGYGFEAIKELDNRFYETHTISSDEGVMARIVKPKELLERIEYPLDCDTSLCIKITDAFFNLNNITLAIRIDKGKGYVSPCQEYDYAISIEELTHLVFGSYKNTNYDPPSILKEVFPEKRVVLTDKY